LNNVSVNKCYITLSANLIILEVIGINNEDILFYDIHGKLVRKEQLYNTSINVSYLNKILAIRLENQQSNEYYFDFYIDGIKQSKTLTYDTNKPFISFSSNERIIMIRQGGMYFLYDIDLELIKEFPYDDFIIYVFNNGQCYLIQDRNKDSYCEIRDFFTNETLVFINKTHYNNEEKPIYFSGVVNRGSDVYVNSFFGKTLVFNFYDIDGNFINSDTTSEFRGMDGIIFNKSFNGYKIMTSYEY